LSGEHVDLVLEDTDSPSNLAATGQNDVLVRMRPEHGARNIEPDLSRLWLWAAADNLRLNAQNAVECALDLRRLRPQGTVQLHMEKEAAEKGQNWSEMPKEHPSGAKARPLF
jgi:aspartate-semialdehyde dehydrogenase